jgi:hypothetical protein
VVSKLAGVRAQGLDWNFLLSIEDVLPGFLLAAQQAACVAHQCRRSLASPRSSSSDYPDVGCKISGAAGRRDASAVQILMFLEDWFGRYRSETGWSGDRNQDEGSTVD